MAIKPIKIKILGVDLFSNKVSGINKKLSSVGKSVGRVGRTLAVTASLPALLLGANIIKTAGDFEQSMNRVRALTGATGKEFKSLEEQSRQLGATTVFSAREAAGAQAFLAQAGFNTNKILGAMPATLNLAAAGQLDLAQTGDIVSNILTGYNKKASETNNVSDILAKTFSTSNTNLEQLGEAFKLAGPIAARMKIPFAETAASIGLLGNAGFQASLAGTSLRGAMTRVIKPSNEAIRVFQKLGIPKKGLINAKGDLIGLINTVKVLEKSGASTADLMEIFGQRAGPAFAALITQGSAKLAAMTKSLSGKNSLGTAAKIAKIQMEGFNGQMKALGSAFDELKIAIGKSGILQFFTKIAKKLTTFTRNLAETRPGLLKLGFIFLGVVAVVGPLLVVLGGLIALIPFIISGLAMLVPVLSAVGALFGFISLPVIILGAKIALVVTAIVLMVKHWKTLMAWVRKVPTVFLLLLGPFGLIIKAAQLITDNWDKVVDIFTSVFNILKKVVSLAGRLATGAFAKVAGFFGFGGDSNPAGQDGRAGAQETVNPIDSLFKGVLGKLDSTLSKIEVKFANEPAGMEVRTAEGGENINVERGLATAGT